jgi:hypothetical protein
MSSPKAINRRQLSPLVSLALKTVGVVMILASLLDMIILPMPYNFSGDGSTQWLLSFTTQVVDRGIIPMIGIALLLAGSWVTSDVGTVSQKKSWQSLQFWALVLSCLLGLLYLLIFPLHLNNVRIDSQQSLAQITQEADQAQTELGTRLNAEVQQQRQQIVQLLENEELLEQAIASGQVPEQQAELLRGFRDDPAALDQYIEQRVGELRTQFETEIGTRREEALRAARTEALKSGLRIGISSLLLAIGYIIIGWSGLRALGQPNRGG